MLAQFKVIAPPTDEQLHATADVEPAASTIGTPSARALNNRAVGTPLLVNDGASSAEFSKVSGCCTKY